MRFTPVLLFGLAAAEVTMHKRQVAAINGVMSDINAQIGNLDQAIKSYTGGAGEGIVSASEKILSTTKAGIATVAGLAPVSLIDAVQIQGVVQTLTDSLKSTIDDLISKKGAIVAAGQGAKTEEILNSQLTGATALAKAISTKVPPEVQSLAITLSGGILDQINRGLAAYKGAGGGAGAGAGASGASPAAPPAGASLSLGSSSADVGTTSMSGSAGSAPMAAPGAMAAPAAAGSASAGTASAGSSGSMSSMSLGSGSSATVDTSAGMASAPAVYTGAGASFRPASVFGLVAVAAAVLAF